MKGLVAEGFARIAGRDLGKDFGQLIRFGLVGGLNTGITLALIFLLGWLGMAYIPANGIGYGAGFINSFVMNRIWTFRSQGDWRREGLLFVIVFAASYLVQLGALVLLKEWLGLGVGLSQLLAMCVYTAVNFVLNKTVTFKS